MPEALDPPDDPAAAPAADERARALRAVGLGLVLGLFLRLTAGATRRGRRR